MERENHTTVPCRSPWEDTRDPQDVAWLVSEISRGHMVNHGTDPQRQIRATCRGPPNLPSSVPTVSLVSVLLSALEGCLTLAKGAPTI